MPGDGSVTVSERRSMRSMMRQLYFSLSATFWMPAVAQASSFSPPGALAERAEDAGDLPAGRPRQRVAVASAVVRAKRHRRPAGRGFRPGWQGQPVPVSGQAAGAQAGAVQLPAAALADAVPGRFRDPAV